MFGEDEHLEMAYEDRFVVADPFEMRDELYEDEECICGEPANGEMAEVYDPQNPEAAAVLCHVSCIPKGWLIA